jgi:hypothetical protein
MAVYLEASYLKKLGLPGYSSHSYSVTIRSEVADLSQVNRESGKLYARQVKLNKNLPLRERLSLRTKEPTFQPGQEGTAKRWHPAPEVPRPLHATARDRIWYTGPGLHGQSECRPHFHTRARQLPHLGSSALAESRMIDTMEPKTATRLRGKMGGVACCSSR